MQFKALNRAVLFNKAIRIYKKKNGQQLTPLALIILYSAIQLQTQGKHVTISSIEQFMIKQANNYSYNNIRIWCDKFIALNVFISSPIKDHSFIVSSYGVTVLQGFELCLRRCRHDR